MKNNKEDKSKIELFHFGELLLKTLLSKLFVGQFVEFLRKDECFSKRPDVKNCTIDYIKNNFKLEDKCFVGMENNFKAKNIEENDYYTVDKIGRVDVCIFSNNGKCLPIEVKMGLNGETKSWSNFYKMNLNDPKKIRLRNDEERYLDGRVPSFLAKNFKDNNIEAKTKLLILDNEKEYDWDFWLLCVLDDVKSKFMEDKSNRHDLMPLLFSIEDLIAFIAKTNRHFDLKKEIENILLKSLPGLNDKLSKKVS